jgi:hypothetical protein
MLSAKFRAVEQHVVTLRNHLTALKGERELLAKAEARIKQIGEEIPELEAEVVKAVGQLKEHLVALAHGGEYPRSSVLADEDHPKPPPLPHEG